jgi:hypothetical protein
VPADGQARPDVPPAGGTPLGRAAAASAYRVPTYEEFRTGLTFRTVRQLLWSSSDDPTTWRYRRRRTVLGFWHQLKQQLYAQMMERIDDGQQED